MSEKKTEKPSVDSTGPSSPEKQRRPPGMQDEQDKRVPAVDRSAEVPARKPESDEDDEHQRGTD